MRLRRGKRALLLALLVFIGLECQQQGVTVGAHDGLLPSPFRPLDYAALAWERPPGTVRKRFDVPFTGLLHDDPVRMARMRRELADARAKWATLGIVDYDLEYNLACYCYLGPDVRVSVRDGRVVSVFDVSRQEVFEPQHGQTVERLYWGIERALSEAAWMRATLDATYDPVRGLPTWSYHAGMAMDSDYMVTLTRITPK